MSNGIADGAQPLISPVVAGRWCRRGGHGAGVAGAAVVLVSPVGGSGRWRQVAAGVAGGDGE
ncbi:hypothetical protein FXF53_07705 [Micromonospora sp. WP24]|uniref:hypothetical protein n=1 Tax=Micromonospora sp. WP24 TaxID=2604469 RepID=UPI0011D5D4A2|nr:hypothetical protein [Micromonospora sp. WP24]TYC04001.1 hypothetical protein FXF53_07705 [Micromonospora sp. WP24]